MSGRQPRARWGAVAREAARHEARVARTTVDRQLAPGRVVVGDLRAFNEGRTDGKPRPVVLIYPTANDYTGDVWAVMGLTTKQTYGNGESRIPVSDWRCAGLSGPGFIWGGRLAFIPIDSITQPLGWIGYEDAIAISGFITRNERARSEFLAAVAERQEKENT